MVIFRKVHSFFEMNRAHNKLAEDYKKVYELSTQLSATISELYKQLSALVKTRQELARRGYVNDHVGGVALQKVSFVEECLVPELNKLVKTLEARIAHLPKDVEEKSHFLQTKQPSSLRYTNILMT